MSNIVTIDVDNAYSVSTDDDSVYFEVEENSKGWWMSSMIDCDSAGFVDGLITDDGPYATEKEAVQAGYNCALEWMANNDYFDYEVDSRISEILA
jgi:hypothetical protein